MAAVQPPRNAQREPVREGPGRTERTPGGARQGTRHGARPDRQAVRQGLDHAHGRARARWRSRPSPPAPWRSTSRSASAACPGAGSSRSSARSRRASRRSPCTSWPRPSATAASAPTSTPSTRWTRSTRRAIGVNVDELLISQPDTGEQALEIADMLIRSGALDVRRDRLGGRAHAPRRDRGRDGRHPRRPAGPADEPGAAQAHRQPQQVPTRSPSSSTSCGRRSA